MALHDKLQAAGSRVKSLCAAPGLAATNLQVRRASPELTCPHLTSLPGRNVCAE
jgi:hypothetical protein